jgi:hypothetical protein
MSVRHEYGAVREAVENLLKDSSRPNYARVVLADQNLEDTYITRLFSEFEGVLRDYLTAYRPSRPAPRAAFRLINRAANLSHIPNAIRDSAHGVREHRNSVVHRDIAAGPAISFKQALSELSKFLAWLP